MQQRTRSAPSAAPRQSRAITSGNALVTIEGIFVNEPGCDGGGGGALWARARATGNAGARFTLAASWSVSARRRIYSLRRGADKSPQAGADAPGSSGPAVRRKWRAALDDELRSRSPGVRFIKKKKTSCAASSPPGFFKFSICAPLGGRRTGVAANAHAGASAVFTFCARDVAPAAVVVVVAVVLLCSLRFEIDARRNSC